MSTYNYPLLFISVVDSFKFKIIGISKTVAITINNIGNTPEPETFFNISNIYTNKAPDICPIRSMNPRETPSWIGYATSDPC